MKLKKFLSGALIFSIAFVGLNANAEAEVAPQASLSERLDWVIDKVSPLLDNFRRAIRNIQSPDEWVNDLTNSVDINLCDKHNVNSIALVKIKEIQDAYVNLIKKHNMGNCRAYAAYIGRLLKEQNIKYNIINVAGNNPQEDNHEVVFIPGIGVIDFFGDFNQNKAKLTIRPLEKFLKNMNWGYKNTITAGYVNEYDKDGYFKRKKDIEVFLKGNNIPCKYKFPLFTQSLGRGENGDFMDVWISRKDVEKALKNSDCSDCKDFEDLAHHEKKSIYDVLIDRLNLREGL